ncbi:hypothetical protein ACIPYS_08745 [Kitasatospora sp. NPDC089913]|uniref:hypothetical protein n=1 Tax=Streptomycetaceae TaxID=2062 RepID=UPI00087953C8|nr:hypothetical protein [Streptomyces sp. TLI_053]SDS69894.1 hypothetical protein SAMN05216371_0436 [Streptomyces sp. TLI_053]
MDETLDRFLPVYGHRAVHGITLAAPPEEVWAALQRVTLADLPLPRMLLALRTLPSRLRNTGPDLLDRSVPLAELFRRDDRWVTLADEPGRALVLGRVARFWSPVPREPARPGDGAAFAAFAEPGWAKAVISHEVFAHGSGSRLVTETRIQGTDARARRRFAAYWLLIRPGVGLIRRSALAAAGRHCESA